MSTDTSRERYEKLVEHLQKEMRDKEFLLERYYQCKDELEALKIAYQCALVRIAVLENDVVYKRSEEQIKKLELELAREREITAYQYKQINWLIKALPDDLPQ
jgi:choline kinase